VFIALGAAMLDAFSFTYVLFAVLLIATAVRLFRQRDEGQLVGEIPLLAAAQRVMSLGPRAIALVAIAGTDLMFAFDSIPAVFGVTQHAYIVFAANAFALLGLRALYFLVSGLLERLIHLSAGLALILAFIGVKLGLHFAHLQEPSIPEISTGVSLAVIAAVLAATTVASLIASRRARLDGGRGGGVTSGDVVQVGGDDSAVDEAPPAREPALGVRAPVASGVGKDERTGARDGGVHAACCSNSRLVRDGVGLSEPSSSSGRARRGVSSTSASRIAPTVVPAATKNPRWYPPISDEVSP
jgi:predicted tellurium resistance membrane protein TerC